MEVKLQLAVFLLLVPVSLAAWKRVTVLKGETLRLRCPVSNAHRSHVEWKNPEGFLMFFNNNKALKDKRYSINNLSQSIFSIRISDISFKDGGNYTCTHYDRPPVDKTVEVTVIGPPRISVTRHKEKISLKCSAQATSSPPLLSWKLDHGSEISVAPLLVMQEKKKYESESTLTLLSLQSRVTVHCLVHHPAWNSQPLSNSVRVGRNSERRGPTVSTGSPTAPPPSSSPGERPPPQNPTLHSDPPTTLNATPSSEPPPSHLSTTGWSSAGETTQYISWDNSTKGNGTGSFSSETQGGVGRKSALLVFLVTSLIAGLLVVLLFLAMKLRRAHVAWRRENEESDPSEDSTKSKSSQEEKNGFVQRRKGLSNTTFTQYVIQEPTVMVPEVNTAAQTVTDSGAHPETTTESDIKETSL